MATLDSKPFAAALAKYRDLGAQSAQLHKQVAEQKRTGDKLLAVAAMDLVANQTLNPLTAKPHSWTSAVEAVKMSERGDEIAERYLELQLTSELAEVEARAAWAEVLFLVRSDANGH